MTRHVVRRGLPLAATVLLTAVAAVLATWPLARDAARASVDSGEVLLTAWQLNWYQHALLTNPLGWADANIYFPYGNTATFNDLLLTHGLITLPVAWADSPILALNLALLGGIVLCGVFAYVLIDELVDAPWPAALGGVLFAIAPFRFLHLGHLSIAAAWAVPLFFWALLRHLRTPSWGRAWLAAAAGFLVVGSSLYHGVYIAPLVPLVLWAGARRGPGGRRVWLPLLAAGLPFVVLLAWMLAPYGATLREFGSAAEPDALRKYGADLSSLAQKPEFLGGTRGTGIDLEARLYPGVALVLLAGAGALWFTGSALAAGGWRRRAAAVLIGAGAVSVLGAMGLGPGWARGASDLATLGLVWVLPVAAAAWAIATTTPREPTGPAVAVRLGLAGAALSYVLALGTEVRQVTRVVGPAPYRLLAEASTVFEGVRVPARFGGFLMLFLALAAAGTVAALARARLPRARLAALLAAALALAGCLWELPVPPLPQGRGLVPLPSLAHPAYQWLRDQSGTGAILELPDWRGGAGADYRLREWRALRYMLASKQHGRPLVNGTGRIRPFFYQRFRGIPFWTDPFFTFVAAYFPVDYVMLHEAGIPPADRDALWARLEGGGDGWRLAYRAAGIRAYTVDRSSGSGTHLDRVFVRRDLLPAALVGFSVRLAPGQRPADGAGAAAPVLLDLARDFEPVASWPIDETWREVRVRVPVGEASPTLEAGWPRAGVLLRWTTRGTPAPAFEIRALSVSRDDGPRN